MARSVSLFWGGLLVFGGVACGPSEGDTPPPADAGSAANAGNAGVSGALGAGAGAGGSSGVAGRAGGVGAGGGGGSGVSGAGGAGAGGAGSGGEGGGGTAGVSSGSGGGGLGGVGGDGEAGSLGGSAGTTGGAAGAGASGMAGSGGGVSGSAGSGGAPPTEPLTIYLAGDSTVSTYNDTASPTDQAGWGQVLDAEFGELVTVENRAIGGRTARRFIDEGALARIFEDIAPGDYLFVQFGTNDGNKTATYQFEGQTIPYYLDPATDFKTYLMKYIEGARERSATPVLVTPPPRNSAYCTGGNGTGAHAAAMRELGAAEGVAVADLNQKTVDHLKAICPAPTPEDFFFVRTDGSVDGTHFQENGARIMAGFVGDGVREAGLPLAALLL